MATYIYLYMIKIIIIVKTYVCGELNKSLIREKILPKLSE